MELLASLLETRGFDEGRAWLEAHSDSAFVIGPEAYSRSKEALIILLA